MSISLHREYPGAWSHVMNRGQRREDIFLDETDYHLLLQMFSKAGKQAFVAYLTFVT